MEPILYRISVYFGPSKVRDSRTGVVSLISHVIE